MNTVGKFAFDPVWAPEDSSLAFGPCNYGRLDEVPQGIRSLPVERCRRATDWTTDGRYLIIELGFRQSTTATVAAWDFEQQRIITLFEAAGILQDAQISPDGRWIAYVSTETGTPEVYVRRFLAEGRAIRLTTGGARSPRWRADGRECFYQDSDGRILAMPATPGGDLANAVPVPRFFAPAYSRPMLFDRGTSFDVTAEGRKFVLRMAASENHAVLVQHWQAKLGQR